MSELSDHDLFKIFFKDMDLNEETRDSLSDFFIKNKYRFLQLAWSCACHISHDIVMNSLKEENFDKLIIKKVTEKGNKEWDLIKSVFKTMDNTGASLYKCFVELYTEREKRRNNFYIFLLCLKNVKIPLDILKILKRLIVF